MVSTTAGKRVSREVKARRAAAVSRGLEMVPPEQADLLAKALPALEAFAETMCEVGLSDRRVTIADTPADLTGLPTLDSRRELRTCCDSQTPGPVSLVRGGRRRHVFPLMGPSGIAGFLEISGAAPLRDDQRQLVCGFLRIYHNHLNILDYGENDELR